MRSICGNEHSASRMSSLAWFLVCAYPNGYTQGCLTLPLELPDHSQPRHTPEDRRSRISVKQLTSANAVLSLSAGITERVVDYGQAATSTVERSCPNQPDRAPQALAADGREQARAGCGCGLRRSALRSRLSGPRGPCERPSALPVRRARRRLPLPAAQRRRAHFHGWPRRSSRHPSLDLSGKVPDQRQAGVGQRRVCGRRGVAERVGFEPTRDLRPYTLSRRA